MSRESSRSSFSTRANLPAQLPSNGLQSPMFPSVNPLKRSRTPNCHDDVQTHPTSSTPADGNAHDERRLARIKDLYDRSDRIITKLFSTSSIHARQADKHSHAAPTSSHKPDQTTTSAPVAPKISARTIDEDDYGDDDDDEDAPPEPPPRDPVSPVSSQLNSLTVPKPVPNRSNSSSSNDQTKTSEDVRKQMEQDKKASEDAAKENFLTTFYTLENDREAMLEQQKLDELDRQVETEMTGRRPGNESSGDTNAAAQTNLFSSGTLGASRLTLKHLIARIDAKRDQVQASDTSLRSLMSEVRKNRSKWASEDRVGQEELYEAAESVLDQLKAKTPHVTPFLQKVNKRDAPDYYKIVGIPMDIGQMMKKLKGLSYVSKKEFVDDLNLIWANCLLYNKHPENAFRKKAEHMRRETDKLIPLIPDIVIRNRAEAEAEERRTALAELGDSDDDDEPIVATRGRKAPSKKGMKGGATTRKAPVAVDEEDSVLDSIPAINGNGVSGLAANFKNDHLRSDLDSVTEGSQHTTPPPGSLPLTDPTTIDGGTDAMEIDGLGVSEIAPGPGEDPEDEDDEYKTWKQVTQKDRARVAAERHQLFRFDKINEDEGALLRTKASMRRWTRQQKRLLGEVKIGDGDNEANDENANINAGTTLAEGMDADNDLTLPDYYDPMSGIPEIIQRLKWEEDNQGHVIEPREECLKMIPEGHFIPVKGELNSKLASNMRQMQDTRKIMAKIGIVKQMQLQAQTYQNQFQKYEPEPLIEKDINAHVISDEGAVMSPYLCRAALQRSIASICFHAGYEDFQPSALEAFTDLASDYFVKIVRTLGIYMEAPKIDAGATDTNATITGQNKAAITTDGPTKRSLKSRFTPEAQILHTLQENDADLDGITTYVGEDLARVSTKLVLHHDRVRDHLAELLRPALDPTLAGADGAGAFADGSDSQFIAGDFAEDIDEDFFGFKELGLDREFGLTGLSIPLHLLQSRVHNAYQPANAAVTTLAGTTMENPRPYAPLTEHNLTNEIGLVHEFFQEKLVKNNGQPLIEDEDLPAKQRFPKPRLPPNGKISSPRKRPVREQQMLARKKRRLEIEAEREREREAEGFPSTSGNSSIPAGITMENSTDAPIGDSGTPKAKKSKAEDEALIDDSQSNEEAHTDDKDSPAVLNDEANGLPNPLTNGVHLEQPQQDGSKDRDPEKAPSGNKSGKTKGEDSELEKDLLSPESMPIAAH